MRRPGPTCALLVWVLAGSACAGSREQARPDGARFLRHGEGPAVATLSAPANGLVELALYVDAGARDAGATPAVATLAARLAARAVGEGARGRALPDAIELRLSCAHQQLSSCLTRLARGLSLRRVAPDTLAAAKRSLMSDQREALARDPERQAELAALIALFGERGAAFLPLGLPSQPEPDARALESFLSAHFGRERALLVAAGALDADALAQQAALRFERVPRASSARRSLTRAALARASDGLRVEVGERHAMRIALLAGSHDRALAVSSRLRQALLRAGVASAVDGHVLPVREGGLSLVRVSPPVLLEPGSRSKVPSAETWLRAAARIVRELGAAIERLRVEGLLVEPSHARDSSMQAAIERTGLRFAASEPATGHEVREGALAVGLLGVGVLVAGGRGDDLVAPDPDAALRKQATEQLTRALSEGRVLARPVLVGAVSNERVEAKLGLAITLRALRSKRADLDALIALAPGAASDPPTHHGRAALLATLLATACGGRTRAELRAELSALGADLEPYVTSRHFGLRLRAPKPHARAALALLAECIARPLLGAREIAYAQRIARESLTRNESALEWRALVAQALVPRTPGALSPLGSLEGLAANDHRSLRELLAASLEHPDVLVSITGPLPAGVAAMQVARRLSFLAARPQNHLAPAPSAQSLLPLEAPHPTRALVVWSVQTRTHAPEALRALSIVLAQRASFPGIELAFHDGDSNGHTAFVALGLRGAPAELSAIVERASALMATLPSVTHWKSRLDPLRALDAQAASVELAALGPPRPKDHEVLTLLGQLRAAPARLVLLP